VPAAIAHHMLVVIQHRRLRISNMRTQDARHLSENAPHVVKHINLLDAVRRSTSVV
jgi:hypothetical protein